MCFKITARTLRDIPAPALVSVSIPTALMVEMIGLVLWLPSQRLTAVCAEGNESVHERKTLDAQKWHLIIAESPMIIACTRGMSGWRGERRAQLRSET